MLALSLIVAIAGGRFRDHLGALLVNCLPDLLVCFGALPAMCMVATAGWCGSSIRGS